MQRALILSDGETVEPSSLILEDSQFEHISDEPQVSAAPDSEEIVPQSSLIKEETETSGNEVAALGKGLKEQEQKIILEALHSCGGKRKDVAEQLGISPRTLRYKIAKMKEQGIELPA
jgi:two-component system response regulator FlrC